MASITLKGREIPLLYTTYEMKTIQEEIAPLGRAIKMLAGSNPDNDEDKEFPVSAERLNVIAKFVRIMGNAALEEAGQDADLTNKKILRAMKQGEIMTVANACLDTMAEGMKSELPDKDEEGPVDVTLEEINKKKERID